MRKIGSEFQKQVEERGEGWQRAKRAGMVHNISYLPHPLLSFVVYYIATLVALYH